MRSGGFIDNRYMWMQKAAPIAESGLFRWFSCSVLHVLHKHAVGVALAVEFHRASGRALDARGKVDNQHTVMTAADGAHRVAAGVGVLFFLKLCIAPAAHGRMAALRDRICEVAVRACLDHELLAVIPAVAFIRAVGRFTGSPPTVTRR